MGEIKRYNGRIPACGVFCGGCPVYIREKNPCPGAEINVERCQRCKSFHLCCRKRGISHCYQCTAFPCYRFRDFAFRWMKYGQDMVENQRLLACLGEKEFLLYYNKIITG